jgi:oligopeptide transport system permease protein
MLKFILRRCLEAIPTLFILITISFFMMRLAPGSPFTERTLPPEVMANIEAKYHLNDPIMTQYFNYLKQLAHGDFGPSFKYKDYSVNDLVASSFPVSAKLGLRLFTGGGSRRPRGYSRAEAKYQMGLCGDGGGNDRGGYTQFRGRAAAGDDICHHAEMAAWRRLERRGAEIYDPADGGLILAYIASIARITRGSMIEVLHSNFIRTARAKGLPMRRIIFRHALKPALLPVLSYMGPAFVGIITGSMVIETIYGLPGIGQLFVNGALNRDYSLVLSLTILVGALTILFNAIVDVLYAVIDPKIRY